MDTRSKIATSSDAGALVLRLLAETAGLKIVRGSFDPLLAVHVAALRAALGVAGRAIVLLRNPAKPLLSSGARAELVAALELVDVVVLPPRGIEPGWLQGLPVTDLDDAPITAQLVELVREKYRDR